MISALMALVFAVPPVAVWSFDEENVGHRVGEVFSVPGVQGRAIRLDGRTGYVTIDDRPELRPQEITVGVWFKLSRLPDNHGVTVACKPQKSAPWSYPFLSWMIRINTPTQIEAAIGA